LKALDLAPEEREVSAMKTLKVDRSKRVRLPGALPGQVFEYSRNGDNGFTLTLIRREVKEKFPPGSLLKYFTAERNKEELAILSGCVQGPK
jgi:hypothetical protein